MALVKFEGIDEIGNSGSGLLTVTDPMRFAGTIRSQAQDCPDGVLDFSKSNYFVCNCTVDKTFSFANVPTDSDVISVALQLHNAGSVVLTFPANVHWGGGVPSFTVAGSDLVGFITTDGGTSWRGMGLNFNSGIPYSNPSI